MENIHDYQSSAILYVDDEEMLLKFFHRAFGKKFRVLTAANAAEGYRLLEQHRNEIGLLMTDQRMPGEKGVQFLERARQLHPRAIRILTTAYSDLDVAIEAVNSGAIYKYVTKPWDIPQLEVTLRRALEFFIVQRERDLFLKEKLSALQKMTVADRVLHLGGLAARMGHYVRNPLVAVRTFLDLAPQKLLEETVDTEHMRNPNFWQEFYEQTQGEMRRLTEMLADLVTATEKNDSPVLRELRLDETVARSVEKLKDSLSRKSIKIINQIPAGLPLLMVEWEKFQRLFDLLLKDEIISLPAGSQIFLSARLRSRKEQEIEIEVRDDGPPWPEAALDSVFDPLSLHIGNHQEFGINLMACYFIVYHHGGRIDVQNRKGQGVTFKLTFPLRYKMASLAEEENSFVNTVLINDALWEKILAGQN
jgi:two-component system, probable response regulator PhcQ